MRLQDLLEGTTRFLEVKGGCATCPRALQNFVPPTLRESSIIFVSDAPSAEKEEFVAKSGTTLRTALKEFGIHPYSFTSTIHCRPPNRDPEPKEIEACLNQYVLEEVKNYPLVVLVGRIASNAFFPGEADTLRGNLAYHPDFQSSRFYGMLHPASVGYDPDRKEEFRNQVERLSRIWRGQTEAPFRMITGHEFRERWERFLYETLILSLDFEVNQLESWVPGGKIKSLSACSVEGDIAEVFSLDCDDPYFPITLQKLGEYCQNPEKSVLGQNIGFDLVWLEAEARIKCNLRHILEIQALYYELQSARWTALKPLVARQLDGYRHLVVWPHKEKDYNRLKLYNAEDVFYPKQLFLRDFPKLGDKTKDLYLRVLGPSSLATRRITHAGIHFRSEAQEPLAEEYNELRKATLERWQSEVPDVRLSKYVTPKGFKDLEEYLFDFRKYPVLAVTDKEKRPATDESAIKELIRQGAKELEHLLEIKGIDKAKSTYVDKLVKMVGPDRRIHANYDPYATPGGRMSSSGPNMQNNPRNNAKRKNQIRHLFGAPPGATLGQGDFSQAELRIAMSLANDPVGIEVYNRGGDVHIETARSILQDEPNDPTMWKWDPYWVDMRFRAKSANFALIYGGSVYTLQQYAMNEFGVILSNEDAELWHSGYFQKFQALQPWHEEEKYKLRMNQGWLETCVGHRWFYKEWNNGDKGIREHEERAAINATCQGPSAHMMNYLIYLCQQAFWQHNIRSPGCGYAEVVLTVHDSIDWEVAEDQAEESVALVQQSLHIVEDWAQPWLRVPWILDIGLSPIWDG